VRHPFSITPDSLRRAAASFNKAPEPTSGSVTPRAIVPSSEMKQWTSNSNAERVAPEQAVAHHLTLAKKPELTNPT
jgi:hypothetical protein